MREAVAVLDTCEAADPAGDGEAQARWEVLCAAMRTWLPPSLWTRLVAAPKTARLLAPALIWEGSTASSPEAPIRKQEAALVASAASQTWQGIVADYRSVYHAPDPWGEPWPDFVAQVSHLDRIRARNALTAFEAASAANGSEEGIERIIERSGFENPSHKGMTHEEQEAALKRITEAYHD